MSIPMNRRAHGFTSILLAAALSVSACGGGGGSTSMPTAPTPAPAPGSGGGTTITISANSVSPRSITVSPGTRVTFVNNDTRSHDMASDPHPVHTDCPEINQVGFLQPGQSRDTGNLTTVRTCAFHDHNQPSNAGLQGSIVIR